MAARAQVVPAVPLNHTQHRGCVPLCPNRNSHLREYQIRAIAARGLQHLAASRDSSSRTCRVSARRARVRAVCAAHGLRGAEGRARRAGLRRGSQPTRRHGHPLAGLSPERSSPSTKQSQIFSVLLCNDCNHLHASDSLINPSSPISDRYITVVRLYHYPSFSSSSSVSLPFPGNSYSNLLLPIIAVYHSSNNICVY